MLTAASDNFLCCVLNLYGFWTPLPALSLQLLNIIIGLFSKEYYGRVQLELLDMSSKFASVSNYSTALVRASSANPLICETIGFPSMLSFRTYEGGDYLRRSSARML